MATESDAQMPRRSGAARRLVLVVGALIVFAGGIAAGVAWSQRRAAAPAREPVPSVSPQGGTAGVQSEPPSVAKGDEPVEVSLTPEGLRRAGIKTAVVRAGAATSTLTVPATVASNAYRDTKVNALVGGVVREVRAELGALVRRGDALAVIFSSDLADAQMKYLSMQATFEADHQKLRRTEKLAQLGAASRQELEEITAAHAGHDTEVAAARQRLLLLGLSADRIAKLQHASDVVSEVTVMAPGGGMVVTRFVNPGQVVNPGQELFTVADLTTVWVIADLYEKDFGSVRVGSPAIVSVPTTATRLEGRVAYIDPRVDSATRTAKARVEVPNRDLNLRLGMFVDVGFDVADRGRRVLVPRSAVQSIGDRTVVYVPSEGEEGRFTERAVKLGRPAGDFIEAIEGIKPGERVVTEGSFFLRAEAARSRAGG